jgi:hypothetical protein
VIGAVACGEADLEQGDGGDPDEAAMDAREPLDWSGQWISAAVWTRPHDLRASWGSYWHA